MLACRGSIGRSSWRLLRAAHGRSQRLHSLGAATQSPSATFRTTDSSASLPVISNSSQSSAVPLSSWHLVSPSSRTYITRAHSKPRPVFPIPLALDMLLEKAAERTEHRKAMNAKYPRQRNHPDETVEFVLGLNVDPRKPGQSLRGTILLPHGSGKALNCIVFTENPEDAQRALEAGAKHAGGEELVDKIVEGEVSLQDIDRGLATSDMMQLLSKKLARNLGPKGLMPNPKTGTLHQDMDGLLSAMETMVMGKEIVYRTEKEGNVLIPVGKISFGHDKLLENIAEAIKVIYSVKPEQHGRVNKKTGKSKASKNAKYVLNCYVSSTQGPGYKLDLRTVDPNNAYFLSDPDGGRREQMTQAAA